MTNRLKIVAIVFVLVGALAFALSPRRYQDRTEEWMEEVVPEQIPTYSLRASSRTDPAVKMSEVAYQILQPFGIVTRYYTGPDNRTYEFVVLAGNTRKSFHDPRVCFTAQGWDLKDPGIHTVNLPHMGGEVQVSAMTMDNIATGSRATAMFFYKTPFGIRPNTMRVPFDLTFAKLMMKSDVDAQFYRFMVVPPSEGDDALQKDLQALTAFAETMFSEIEKRPEGSYFLLRK
ncbi:MAG: hypothetical protein KatS3mg015_0678 [Fimbriimonadales bacterium]|nr:MAG: hypothetical protein KatS3mg015_0678 [Fimbriimonadales bacterium]